MEPDAGGRRPHPVTHEQRLPSDRPFRGSAAVRAGLLSRDDLRGPRFRRVGGDLYVAADVPDSLDLAIRIQALRAAPVGVVTGWSAC
jgi:hypothetical protein